MKTSLTTMSAFACLAWMSTAAAQGPGEVCGPPHTIDPPYNPQLLDSKQWRQITAGGLDKPHVAHAGPYPMPVGICTDVAGGRAKIWLHGVTLPGQSGSKIVQILHSGGGCIVVRASRVEIFADPNGSTYRYVRKCGNDHHDDEVLVKNKLRYQVTKPINFPTTVSPLDKPLPLRFHLQGFGSGTTEIVRSVSPVLIEVCLTDKQILFFSDEVNGHAPSMIKGQNGTCNTVQGRSVWARSSEQNRYLSARVLRIAE